MRNCYFIYLISSSLILIWTSFNLNKKGIDHLRRNVTKLDETNELDESFFIYSVFLMIMDFWAFICRIVSPLSHIDPLLWWYYSLFLDSKLLREFHSLGILLALRFFFIWVQTPVFRRWFHAGLIPNNYFTDYGRM